MSAFKCRYGDENWALLVFARTHNEARYTAHVHTHEPVFVGNSQYVDWSARRAKNWDQYSRGLDPYVIYINEDLPRGAKPFYSTEC